MNRPVAILSVLSFVGIIILTLLMFLGVINFFNNFKYLVVLTSVFLTLFSLGWFIHQQELPKLIFAILLILLVLPVFIPAFAIIDGDSLTPLWKIFIAGSIFQIGTGIYALLGGFIKRGLTKYQKYMSTINYIIFLFLSGIMLFNISSLMVPSTYIVLGSIASLLSVLLVITRKSTVSL